MSLYENTMSIEALRLEIRELWDSSHAFADDLRKLPEIPSQETMRHLTDAAMAIPGDALWQIGKRLQRAGHDVPFVSECERAAGLWTVLRNGLLALGLTASADAPISPAPQGVVGIPTERPSE